MDQITLTDISKKLTESVVEKAFKEKTKSEDSVKSIVVTRAAPAGEGLLSTVYRVHVTGHKNQAQFIIKALGNSEVLLKTLQCAKYFEREITFFKDILPILKEVQKSTGAKENVQDTVPLYYSSCMDGQNDYIILEDLSESKLVSLSENPTESDRDKVLKSLAQIHAVSLALRLKKPDVFQNCMDKIPELYFNEYNQDWYTPYLMDAARIDRQVLIEHFDSSSVYIKRFDELISNDLYGNLISSVSSSVDIPVFCHGDSWIKNFLVSPDAVKTIDFQIYRCTSLVTDVAYFILQCSNICKNKQDFMNAVDVYYRELSYYLADMHLDASEVYSRATLDKELKMYGKFGFLANITSIPLMAGERTDTLTVDSLMELEAGQERIPLEKLWKLSPLKEEHKFRLVNLIQVAVDVGLI